MKAFVTTIALGSLLVAAPAGAQCTGTTLCAGAASVDMTWHVGSGQGQYGSPRADEDGVHPEGFEEFDPFHHQTKMVPSDGLQSRTYAKAIVVEGHDPVSGERVKAAYVKTELYLQQDVLTRRVGELVSGADPLVPHFAVTGLRADRVMLGATHNHSAPEYASTAYGVWLFTDTFDFRMFETTARKIAEAVKLADGALEPARLGASVVRFGEVQRNILGPGVADDGTPAGFPHDYFDDELSVIRFERLDGTPVAAWVNLGMHPESIATVDLVSADFVGMVERLAERDLGRPAGAGATDGPIVVWSQGSVGDVEPDQSR
ncbi:MAG: neutral/alkaline non-lysosomal ceramidase N-terminal domain-containing protein, partial [Candidatus Binatia bacterium]